MLKEILAKLRERKDSFKDAQHSDRVAELIAQRKKNSNERELEGYLEEERQKKIKLQLDYFRAKQREENRRQTVLGGKNVFSGHKSVLTENKNVFNMDNDTFKTGMFFKRGSL